MSAVSVDSRRTPSRRFDAYVMDNHFEDLKQGYVVPALSELIDACGDEKEFHLNKLEGFCQARKNNQIGEGSTPEEAVARLWLALQNTKPSGSSLCDLRDCKGPAGHAPHSHDILKYDGFEATY
jgi:hypothetical protein